MTTDIDKAMTDLENLATRLEQAGPESQAWLLRDAYQVLLPPPSESPRWNAEWIRFNHMLDCGAYLSAAEMLVPEGWFIYGLGEAVKPILHRGDLHEHLEYWTEVQRREGGLLQKAAGTSLALTLAAAYVRAAIARKGS